MEETKERSPGDATGPGQAAETAPSRSVPRKTKLTPEERIAALRFLKAAHEDALVYMAMSEEEEQEEYRRAGKLHRYDPDKEWQKRYARIGRKYRPPKSVAPYLDEFLKYLEEDEADDDAPPSAT